MLSPTARERSLRRTFPGRYGQIRSAFIAPKFEPSRFEAAFANCERTVFDGKDVGSLDVLDELERNDEWNVVNDASFVRAMTEMPLRDSRKALRYLFGINARSQTGVDVIRKDKCSVEHILPQSETHWKDWTAFNSVNAADWVFRTGNLVVVARRENRTDPEFNRNFAAKRRAFQDSALSMPRRVADKYEDRSPQAIDRRSRQLAKAAATTWEFARAGRV